jgi:hypothetical protein
VKLSIYCSGSIKKGKDDEGPLWGDDERQAVSVGAGTGVVYLNPDDPIVTPHNVLGQFGRDMYQVMVATAVVVDARARRGLGVGVEMAAAGILGTPVIVVAPPNSKYRMDELTYRGVTVNGYIHPHVAAIAHSVVDDFVEAGQALVKLAGCRSKASEEPSWLSSAIEEYENHVLPHDPPMLRALKELGREAYAG